MNIYTIELYPETCCDLCNEIIHNHIDICPVCKTDYAPTDIYHDLYDWKDSVIQCTECKSYFKLVGGKWYGDDDTAPKVIQVYK